MNSRVNLNLTGSLHLIVCLPRNLKKQLAPDLIYCVVVRQRASHLYLASQNSKPSVLRFGSKPRVQTQLHSRVNHESSSQRAFSSQCPELVLPEGLVGLGGRGGGAGPNSGANWVCFWARGSLGRGAQPAFSASVGRRDWPPFIKKNGVALWTPSLEDKQAILFSGDVP